jgi:hypothetical protein
MLNKNELTKRTNSNVPSIEIAKHLGKYRFDLNIKPVREMAQKLLAKQTKEREDREFKEFVDRYVADSGTSDIQIIEIL